MIKEVFMFLILSKYNVHNIKILFFIRINYKLIIPGILFIELVGTSID